MILNVYLLIQWVFLAVHMDAVHDALATSPPGEMGVSEAARDILCS